MRDRDDNAFPSGSRKAGRPIGQPHQTYDGYVELTPGLEQKIVLGDPRFVVRLRRAEEILDSAVPSDLTVPVDIDQVLQHFDLGKVLVESDAPKGKLGGLRRVGDCWHPVVYRRAGGHQGFSARERFTIAHEVAHAIVDDELRLRPVRASQYWALEAACNDFASRLLIPDAQVFGVLPSVREARSALDAIWKLANLTETSLVASARRLTGKMQTLSAWGLLPVTHTASSIPVFEVKWAAGTGKSVLGRRTRLGCQDALYGLVVDDQGSQALRDVLGEGTLARHSFARGYALVVWHTGTHVASVGAYQPRLSLE